MACKLQLMNGQSGVYTAESIQELQNYVREAFRDAIDNSEGGTNGALLKLEVKRALYKIGNTYNDLRLINAVVRYIQEVAKEEDFLGIEEFYPEAGLYKTVSIKFRDKDVEERTQNSYVESETTKEELGFIKSLFLDNFLGNKARLKNLLKQDVTHKLLNTFIINRQDGRIITNIGEANRMARQYKLELFDLVMNYFKRNLPNEYKMTKTNLYDGDKYTGVIQEAKMLTRYFDIFTPALLQAIHDTDIDKYNAITAWFTLRNFDNFINLLLGDIININPEHRNTFKDGDGYQYSDKGTQVITSWRTDDNIILESEIGALAQSLINSTPFYKFGINNKTNKFIKFEDFYRMITKIKDLAIDPKSRTIIINRRTHPYLFGENSDLTLLELQIIENKSLRSIINNIRINPLVYTRLAIRMLVLGDTMKELGYTEEERDKTWSIYKGFFSSDDNESVYRIQNQDVYDHNVKNYYSLITQVADSLFTVNFLQYNEDEGVVTVRTLKDLGSDNIRRRLETSIAGFNSRRIIETDFENQHMSPYQMSPIINETSGKFEGIKFTIEREDDMITDTNYNLTIALTDLGRTLTIYDAYGNILQGKDLSTLLYDFNFKLFIDKLLNLGLTYDTDLLEAIETVYSGSGAASAAIDLLNMAANVYMNKYISNVLLKEVKGRKKTLAKLKEIYSDSELAPTYNSNLGEINLLPLRLIPSLNRIAAAKSITTGEALSAQVRDADGNMLSSQTLSRLLGALQSQWERILQSPDNAAQGFSLLQTDLFKGCYTTKEYKSMVGNKQHTQFTVAESILGNFLYDFVGGFISVDNTSGKKIIGNGTIGLLPSVNSDKNTIGRMILDLSQECKVEGIPSITELGKNKTWAELTVTELLQIIAKELGQSYNRAYNNVVSDFNKLQEWLATNKNIVINIDPETDFKELNEYCESQNISTSEQLYNWTREYNNIHTNNPIRLILQTHYVKNGKGIKFNNTFKALRRRYNNAQKLAEFFDLKRTEMLKSLIDENIEINLFDDTSDKTTPKKWLRNNFPDWMHKIDSNGKTIKNGKMVLAKITYDGVTYSITSKSDLIEFNNIVNYKLNKKVNFIESPHKLLNPAFGIKVELHPMLDKYNTMDYLFTLEFMIAGVGSHINHPGKAKYKTPILFGYPTMLDLDLMMSWEEEFMPRYEKFLIKHGLEPNPENPVIKDFIKKEWERAKELANSCNMALITQDDYIYRTFFTDFTKLDSKDAEYNAYAQLRENEIQEEAARFLAQHKRNVSYTAAMHEFQLGSVNGIPTEYNMAIIDDITASVYTISGDRSDHAPFDGATFVNPFVVIWENNSLEGDKAGIDKKQFVHYYDELTGTGGIIKTAGFGLTNDRIRRYGFYRDMMYNMTNRVWKNADDTNHIAREGGILIDFNGNDVNYGPIYFQRGNKYYMREINSYMGNNTYKTTLTEVDITGEPINGNSIEEEFVANSNYTVWLMFGGHNSMEIKDGELVFSEKSIQLTARAANNYGIKKEGITKVYSADDVIQPMKMADIHYMPTVGAIKQGACNINPKSCYYGHHSLNFMKVKMLQAGIQLDKEHHADNSELSLMTLVISAACANGYKPAAAERLYNAIYSLTKAGTREFRNEMGDMITGNKEKFDQAVTGIIMKAMLNSTSSDGDLVQAIAQDLLKEMKTSKDFSFSPEFYKKADSIIPNSDPTVYPKIVNMLTVALTKSGIKTKMPGILAVLCPSHEIIKFYKIPILDETGLPTGKYKRVTIDKLELFYDTDDINSTLEKLQLDEPMLKHSSDIEMGYKYLITHTDGTQEVVHINRIHGKPLNEGFREHNNKTLKYSEISYEDFKKMDIAAIQEWVKEGLDLKSYNVRFEDNEGNKYQIADLEIVQDYFKLKDEKAGDNLLLFALSLLSKYGKQQEFSERVSYDLRKAWGDDLTITSILEILKSTPEEIVKFCDNYKVASYPLLGQQLKSYLMKRSIHFMNREMQLALDGISEESPTNIVHINGLDIIINKDTITKGTYGLVMPKTFKSNLGLDEFDDLEDIKNDPMFFVKKLANKFGTKVEIYENEEGELVNNYHLELKRSDGKHIYIREGLTKSDLVKEVEIFKRTEKDGTVYRINSNNEIMYQLHSADDKVYLDLEGNEIIVTTGDKVTWTDVDGNEVDITGMDLEQSAGGVWIDKNTGNEVKRRLDSGIQFYLDTMDYVSFGISRACSDKEFSNILSKALNSINQSASRLANRIAKIGNDKDRVKKLIALRNLVNKMNNYNAMLEDAELKDFAMIHLKELGEQMHTSFLRSLEIIAARIPAQNQQSFMSMLVEAYDNPDINSAYVSIFQFYLLGSDLKY